jgi:hypothetical protein
MEILSPLEASLDHVWTTPPSHFTPQKVRGFVDGLTGLRNGTITLPKILLISRVVKGKIAFKNSPGFQAQIEDLHLKCCILMENPKNNISRKYSLAGHFRWWLDIQVI